MTDDPLDFLEEKSDEVTEPEQVEAEAPEAEPVVDAEDKGEIAEPPSASEDKTAEGRLVALMDEREKRQQAEKEAKEARERLAELEKRMAETQPAAERPDFFENPEAVVQQHVLGVKLQQSKFLAERDYGADLVAEAYAYFDKHPEESKALLSHASPFHAAVEHYKRQKTVSEMGADPDAWIEQQVQARLAERLAQAEASAPKAPPPSMSRAPSTGGERISPGSAFDDVFGG